MSPHPPHPTAAHCTALAQKGNGNVFVRVGAYNPLTDEALRKVRGFITRGALLGLSLGPPSTGCRRRSCCFEAAAVRPPPLATVSTALQNKYSLRRVTRVVEHPGYQHLDESEPTSPNDLALLLLDKPVPDRFPAVRLPNGALLAEPPAGSGRGQSAEVCGCGCSCRPVPEPSLPPPTALPRSHHAVPAGRHGAARVGLGLHRL